METTATTSTSTSIAIGNYRLNIFEPKSPINPTSTERVKPSVILFLKYGNVFWDMEYLDDEMGAVIMGSVILLTGNDGGFFNGGANAEEIDYILQAENEICNYFGGRLINAESFQNDF